MASSRLRSSSSASRLFSSRFRLSCPFRSFDPSSPSSQFSSSSRVVSSVSTLVSAKCGPIAPLFSRFLSRRNFSAAADRMMEEEAKSSSWRKYVIGGLGVSAGLYLVKHYYGPADTLSSQAGKTSSGELMLPPPKLAPAGVPQSFFDELQKFIPKGRVIFDKDERDAHGKPWNSYHRIDIVPDAVVYPVSTEEVVAIVKLCQKFKAFVDGKLMDFERTLSQVPVVPYGAATSVEGHTLTMRGGVSLDMTLMKKIKEVHVEDMDVVVEAGMGWIELNQYLKPKGLFFPLDPGPGATVGGMCACRCSGSLAVRYGTMRDNVISLKVVTANGDVVKTASRARKSAAGYDLTRLMIGSEGTLGIITEVTLRLQKIPQASTVAMCSFPSIKDAADVAIDIMHSGIQASRVELLDEVMIKAVNMANGKDYKEAPTLMFELIGTEAYALEQTEIVKKIAEKHNGSNFVYAETPAAKDELWKIRKEVLWSTQSLNSEAEIMTTDVCVPLSKLAQCIAEAKTELDASPLITGIIAHAGDGNFHTLIMFDPDSKEETNEAKRLSDSMVNTALALEGTCTGEHGVGIGKMKYLEKELGPEALKMMGSIKEVLDPDNIMNPGKIIPPQFCNF